MIWSYLCFVAVIATAITGQLPLIIAEMIIPSLVLIIVMSTLTFREEKQIVIKTESKNGNNPH